MRDMNREFNVEVNKVEKNVTLEILNPNYWEIQKSVHHLRDIILNDTDTKKELPLHIIIRTRHCIKINTQERARIWLLGQTVAELTKIGWVVISPGQENTVINMLYSKTTVHDYKNLCSLNILGIEKNHKKGNKAVHVEFQKQLGWPLEGWCETNLLWKDGH